MIYYTYLTRNITPLSSTVVGSQQMCLANLFYNNSFIRQYQLRCTIYMHLQIKRDNEKEFSTNFVSVIDVIGILLLTFPFLSSSRKFKKKKTLFVDEICKLACFFYLLFSNCV